MKQNNSTVERKNYHLDDEDVFKDVLNKKHFTFDDIHIKPKYSDVSSRSRCDLSSNVTKNFKIEKPFIASPMDTVCEEEMAFELWKHGCLGIIHRFDPIERQVNRVKTVVQKIGNYKSFKDNGQDKSENLAAAIGATGDFEERADRLVEAGVNILLIDIAHGHHKYLRDALNVLNKKEWRSSVDIIGGSIATAEAAKDLIEWGVDGLRIGLGNGSMCSTRMRSGVGVPQVSAILEVYKVARLNDTPILADGGIKRPGDAAKALAIGADTIMAGSLFSGTKETPGPLRRKGNFPNEKLYKQYRGSASYESKLERGEETSNIEGNSQIVDYKGKVKRIVSGLEEGVQSAMSYSGAKNMEEFHSKAEVIKVSNAGHREGTVHGFTE